MTVFIIFRALTVVIFVVHGILQFTVARDRNAGLISLCFALANYLIFFGRGE